MELRCEVKLRSSLVIQARSVKEDETTGQKQKRGEATVRPPLCNDDIGQKHLVGPREPRRLGHIDEAPRDARDWDLDRCGTRYSVSVGPSDLEHRRIR